VAEFGEQCDGENLQGHTCQTQGFTYGKLECGGSCTFDTSGCTNSRFVDNGNGTITDNQTGLIWEKKSSDGHTPPCVVDPVFNTGCTSSCTVTTCSCTASGAEGNAKFGRTFPPKAAAMGPAD